ncbi:uncharacterized protein F4812DRAFT_455781 [Daldinia caldariorum]|uniref:uncharacterized protein n=1 Tax=Daldinia caldariorum TaxID=326644 RepID=UPI0020076E5C|nr:uncharacterized protein F4812DRAFT_455781 [Daldinia caldariorum]KAI1471674.1 hypothetical protein F4812DRAFT_455781 [Daldinia caldariorum]
MYNINAILAAFLFGSAAVAQSLPPSPTASVGCHPHGDHWHCDGPASATSLVTLSGTESSEVSQTLAPSPTESVGCHPHGDHWHCDGPASATASSTSSVTDDHHDEETTSLPPSPTESVGCHPHGDHWHCDGPAVTVSTSSSEPVETGGVGKVGAGNAVILGGLLAVAAIGL